MTEEFGQVNSRPKFGQVDLQPGFGYVEQDEFIETSPILVQLNVRNITANTARVSFASDVNATLTWAVYLASQSFTKDNVRLMSGSPADSGQVLSFVATSSDGIENLTRGSDYVLGCFVELGGQESKLYTKPFRTSEDTTGVPGTGQRTFSDEFSLEFS